MEIAELDSKILAELLRDSRLSFREIARRVGSSVGTVLSRVRRMEEAGVIKGYTAILDHEKLGYQLTAITELTVSRGRLLEVEREVAKLPNTCAVYDVTGDVDAIVIAKFKRREDLSNFTKGLLALPFVERTNTHVILTTIKEDFRLL
jgi:DNA-binding Lrp family transcriptional regulator